MDVSEKLWRLDAARGFAASYVVLHHIVPKQVYAFGVDVGLIFRFGQEAVMLFFLLSGFVINFSYQRSRNKSFGYFFLRRFLRIYIPLVVVIVVGYILGERGSVQLDLKQALGNLLMLQDIKNHFPGVIIEPYFGNTPLWSLSYEWWFYMLFFFVTRYFPRRRHLVSFGISLVASLLYILEPIFVLRVAAYFSIWWVGVFLAELKLKNVPITVKSLGLPLAVLFAVDAIHILNALLRYDGVGAVSFHPLLEVRHISAGIGIVLMALVWQRWRWFGFGELIGPFLHIAPISYALYISHWYLLVSASYLSFIGKPVIEYILYAMVMFAFCYFLERRLYPAISRLVLVRGGR